jgi:acetolactate synthase-1/2/3 large subunit
VGEALNLLQQAKRPVLFIGNGARAAYRMGLVTQLADLLKIPVLLTWKAMDMFPEDYPQYAGRPGSVASRGANFTQQNADCILMLGARLDLPQLAFNHKNFAPCAKKILVEIDPKEIAKLDMHIDVPVNADVGEFLQVMLGCLTEARIPRKDVWLAKTREWARKYPVILPEYWRQKQGAKAAVVDTYVLVDVLSDLCTSEDVLAPGSSGTCSDIFLQCFRLKPGQRVVNSPSLGAMGTGLPGSIGTCLASGRRRTICVNGDGGFQMNIQELETVRRLNLPIKYFVLCNGSYASIMATQRNYFEGRMVGSDPSSRLTLPDIRKVAEAYGIVSREIRDHANIREEVQAVLHHPGPVVCAVNVSSEQVTAPRAISSQKPDGTIASLPMEDMSPRLPREVFLTEMIIPVLEY